MAYFYLDIVKNPSGFLCSINTDFDCFSSLNRYIIDYKGTSVLACVEDSPPSGQYSIDMNIYYIYTYIYIYYK